MKLTFAATALALTALAMPSAASAATVFYFANLDGLTEAPPNASPGSGWAIAGYDDTAHTLNIHLAFIGLLGTTTAAHIHGPTAVAGAGTAGVITTTPTFAGFPLGVTGGSYAVILDLTSASSYNPAFVTAQGGLGPAEATFVSALASGKAYLNIHSTAFPGGEIRGFFQLAVPEPASWAMMIGGFALAGGMMRRRVRVAFAG
jgi:hypothetical protein